MASVKEAMVARATASMKRRMASIERPMASIERRVASMMTAALAPLPAFLLALLVAAPARSEVASAGLAGAYTLRARGVDAPAWNPAALAWNPRLDVRVFSVAVMARNNAFSMADYNRWNGAVWSEADKKAILDRIPGGSFEGRARGSAEGPGAAWRGWAVTIGNVAAGAGHVPAEFARLILWGNTPDESFDLSGTGGDGIAWSELRLSHGRVVAHVGSGGTGGGQGEGFPIAVGASIKILHGWAYGEVTQAYGGFVTGMDAIRGGAVLTGRTAGGGTGIGVDLGAAMRGPNGWDFAVSLRDLYAGLEWSRDPREHREEAVADSVTIQDLEDNEDLVTTHSTKTGIASFRSSIPPVLTLAVGRAIGRNSIEADLSQGLRDKAGVSSRTRLALGASRAQWRWIEGRLGLAVGGADGPVGAAGVGFALWKVRCDLAASSSGTWNLFSPKGIGFGMALGLRWI
jgi:hypothetical protein